MDQEQKSAGSMKNESLKERVSNTTDNSLSECEGEPIHSSLSDVALYSLSGLVAVSLVQLFEDDCHREFRTKALEKILQELKQPKQVTDAMMMINEGEVMSDSSAFVDTLMQEECLKTSQRSIILHLISSAISEGQYDSRIRMLIKHIAWQLRVTWEQVEEIETDLAESLEYDTYVMSEEEALEKAHKAKNRKLKRYALIGLATVGGGALIGLTGGLAAPLVAAGAGVFIGGAGAAALGSAAGVAIIGSLFGVAGAGLTGYKMKRRVGAIEEFSFDPLTLIGSQLQAERTVKQLHITIAVTGWLNEKIPDFRIPWSALAESREQYSLRWESKYLIQLGKAFDYILQTGISVATTEALKYTILSGLIAAITWPAALISAAGVIDNPWHVCTQRSEAVGKQLAEVLLAREQGNRPVTLIGFSMGARVIFYCLEELSKRKASEGLIEDVILLGAPVSGDPKNWMPFSRIVAGKIVNGYSRGDWLLKFLYRTVNVKLRVAGLGPVKWDNRRMHNIDLTDVIDGHSDYIKNLDIIMKAVGVRTKDKLKPLVQKSRSKLNIPKINSTHSVISDTESVSEAESDADIAKGAAVGETHTNPTKVLETSNISNSAKDDDLSNHQNQNKTVENISFGDTKTEVPSHLIKDKLNIDNSVIDETALDFQVNAITGDKNLSSNSKYEGHFSGRDGAVSSSIDTILRIKVQNEADGKGASTNDNSKRSSETSLDLTSSDSEVYTPSESISCPLSEIADRNMNSLDEGEVEETTEKKPTEVKLNVGESRNKETEMKRAMRVEDEIRQTLRKETQDKDLENVHSESCYFTDSDPEGDM